MTIGNGRGNTDVIVSLVMIFILIMAVVVFLLILGLIIYRQYFHKRVRVIKFCESNETKLSEALKVLEVNV